MGWVLFPAVRIFIATKGKAEEVTAQGMQERWQAFLDGLPVEGPGCHGERSDLLFAKGEGHGAEHAGLAGDPGLDLVGTNPQRGLPMDVFKTGLHGIFFNRNNE